MFQFLTGGRSVRAGHAFQLQVLFSKEFKQALQSADTAKPIEAIMMKHRSLFRRHSSSFTHLQGFPLLQFLQLSFLALGFNWTQQLMGGGMQTYESAEKQA